MFIERYQFISKYKLVVCALKNYNLNSREKFIAEDKDVWKRNNEGGEGLYWTVVPP